MIELRGAPMLNISQYLNDRCIAHTLQLLLSIIVRAPLMSKH